MKRGLIVGLFLCALFAAPAQASPYLSTHQARVAIRWFGDDPEHGFTVTHCRRIARPHVSCRANYFGITDAAGMIDFDDGSQFEPTDVSWRIQVTRRGDRACVWSRDWVGVDCAPFRL